MAFFGFYNNGYIVWLKVIPNASCTAGKGVLSGVNGREYLKLALNAVPCDGKANKELVRWLAKKLKIAKNAINIISGESEHYKKIFISADKNDEIEAELTNLAEGKC